MQLSLESKLNIWFNELSLPPNDISNFILDFNKVLNDALSCSIKKKNNQSFNNNNKSNFKFNHHLFNLFKVEDLAYKKYIKSSDSNKSIYEKQWKNAKCKLKNALRYQEYTNRSELVANIELLRSNNPRDYWKKLYELDNTQLVDNSLPMVVKNSEGKLVSGIEASNVWMESFAKLGREDSDNTDFNKKFFEHINNQVNKMSLESYNHSCILDQPIKLEEVKIAVDNLKNGKAVGLDGLFNEMFKYGGDKVTEYLWKVYQQVFESEEFPEVWSKGMIFPLFKGGPDEYKLDPNKYRGITLLSIVGKIYTVVLNNRLSDWAESNGIFVDEQAGFRKERSTVDQLFILFETIRSRRPKATYVAFLDIAKAYDKVYRNGVWYKLWKLGIRGKMWRVLKNIYRKVESCVLLGDRRTAWFLIEVGLRQGCILSPILFLLFINDLRDVVGRLNKGVQVGDRKLSILFFADDIAVVAESKEDLEEMLDCIYSYGVHWRIKWNLDKSGVIVFHTKTRSPIVYGTNCINICNCNHHFRFGPFLINEVLVYRYLGLEIDYRLVLKDFKLKILSKARSNCGRIWYMGIKEGVLSVKAAINLYQSLVVSGLEYGSEIWGFDKWSNGEQVQYHMARSILRCSFKASRPAVIGELGLMSLYGRRCYKKLMFWFHLINLPDNRLIKQVFLESKLKSSSKCNWYRQMGKIFKKYDLLNIWKK